MRRALVAIVVLAVSGGLLATTASLVWASHPCTDHLVAVGPVSSVNGFPEYYVDSNGVGLELCLDTNLCIDPLLDLPDPNAPLSWPNNFPEEAFWWLADALINLPVIGGQARLVLALEAAYFNGPVQPGEEISFGRVRVRGTGLEPNASYTFTHPFGVEVVTTDAIGLATFTDDVGIPVALPDPTPFEGALQSRIGPFLSAVNPPPPTGQLGNFFVPQTISGSPCGTNFFRIEGPGLPPGGVETDKFLVLGKIKFICGNGVLEAGEECDDGNLADGDCCSPACRSALPGTLCSDGNSCTAIDACDGAGSCIGVFHTGPCVDGNPCTVGETCDGAGACAGGAATNCDDADLCTSDSCDPASGCINVDQSAVCDDANPCTDDSCDPALGCINAANDVACDDANPCTVADGCSGGSCVGGPALSCDDGNPCTDDGCDSDTGCTNVDNTAVCDDGDPCTTEDSCVGGSCVGAVPPSCDDGNPCTDDSCDSQLGCRHLFNDSPCDDGNPCTDDSCDPVIGCVGLNNALPCDDGDACTTNDSCVNGLCTGGTPLDCIDGNPCTDDVCDSVAGCVHTDNTVSCDDGDACTTGDVCMAGLCVGGPAPDCNDSNGCTDDGCDVAVGCVSIANTLPCDDGLLCTESDTCSAGDCAGTPVDCNDGNPCTANLCDVSQGCVAVNIPAVCDDGDACTTGDLCSAGVCAGGAAPNCDDGDLCTDDVCDVVAGCLHTDNTVPCDDGDACTTGDLCSAGFCVGGPAPDCTDGNGCTDDSCDSVLGCLNAANTASCDDGSACTTGDTCISGLCVGGAAPDCTDGNGCSDDSCDPASGCVSVANTAACDDGDACTISDTCTAGLCVGGAAPNCDDDSVCTNDSCDSSLGCVNVDNSASCNDANGCTDDSCDAVAGCVNAANTAPCDDGNVCTTADTCGGRICVGGPALDCDDGNLCTSDGCGAVVGCVHLDNAVGCDDGDACTVNDHCGGGVCGGGGPLDCDDGNPCTDDGCDAALGCLNAANAAPCDDGDACTTNDSCSGGVCVGGTAPDCDDGQVCTDDSCDPVSGCTNVANTATCDDGDACTTNDSCSGGGCVGGAAPNCDDGDVCTDEVCDSVAGCVHTDNAASCDDGDACTTGDICSAGICVGGPAPDCNDGSLCTDDFCDSALGCGHLDNSASCDDGNPCTANFCNASSGCVSSDIPASCDDGDACTANDSCAGGVCVGGPAPDCSDSNLCTDDSCNSTSGCVNANNTSGCDDGDACTTGDTCISGFCVGGPPPNCDDGNLCTDDGCDAQLGCESADNTAPCDDGDPCTTSDSCSLGACVGGVAPDCDDGNGCTDDSCDSVAGCQSADNTAPCDDGDACTTNDSCAVGACVGRVAPDCDDGNGCTDDSCDSAAGCQSVANSASCDDGDATTVGDQCFAGVCVAGGFGCPALPLAGCREPVTDGKARLTLKNSAVDSKDKLSWVWKRGASTSKTDYGDPVGGATSYRVCTWDETAGQPQLVMEQALGAGGDCSGRPCWKSTAKAHVFKDRSATVADGLKIVVLKSGADGKALVKVKGGGAAVGMATLPLRVDPKLTVELIRDNGLCWRADFLAPAVKNDSKLFKGKASTP